MELIRPRRRLRRRAYGVSRVGEETRVVRVTREGTAATLVPVDAGRGGQGRSVVGLVTDLSVRHERLQLPAMPRRQLPRAVEHRVATQKGREGEREVSFVPYRPGTPNDMLLVTASMRATTLAFRQLTDAGYRVERLTSVGAALTSLASAAIPPVESGSAITLFHFGDEVGTVAFVLDTALVLSREFRMPAPVVQDDGTLALDPDHLEILVGELGRSLLYFNHQFQGKPVGRVLISSDLDGADPLVGLCRERFEVPVDLTMDAMALDVSGFARDDGPPATAGRWVSAIAAAIMGLVGSPDVDLLPIGEVARRRKRRTMIAAVVATGVLAACMYAAHSDRLSDLRSATTALKRQAANIEEMNEIVDGLEEVRDGRLTAAAEVAFLERSRWPLTALSESIRQASRSVTDSLRVERVELRSSESAADGSAADGSERLELRVSGRITGLDGAGVQQEFSGFLEHLREHPVFERAEVQPIVIDVDDPTRVSVLQFEIVTPLEG